MQPILVAYATSEGQTRKIAEFIAERLRIRGHRVDLIDTAGPTAQAVEPIYLAAFLGGPVYHDKQLSALTHFIKVNIDWLKVVPTGFFSVGLATTQPDPEEGKKAKEGVREFLQETGLAPVVVRHVAGALRYTQYDFFKRMVARTLSSHVGAKGNAAQDQEYTDWNDVEVFVDEVLAAAKVPGTAKAV